MEFKTDLQVKGVITLGNLSNTDLAGLGAPVGGLGSVIFNTDNQRLEQWDGSAWIASVPMVHPAVTVDAGSSSWLTVDTNSQVASLVIPAGSFYTQAEVDTKFSDLVGGAGAAYDTLQEIAAELQNNDNDITSILSDIASNDTDIADLVADNASQDTAIATNTNNILANDTDITALQAVSHDAVTLATGSSTTLVLNGQELNLDLSAIESDIATNVDDIAANTAAINSGIAGTNAQVFANTASIDSNDTDIAALQADSHVAVTLGNTFSGLTLNGQELELDLSGIENDIATNTTNITSNDADILQLQNDSVTNATNITSNDADIAANTAAIATNSTDIDALEAQAHPAATVGTNANGISVNSEQEIELELLDEDGLVSDSDTRAATQQSVKAYVDNIVHDAVTLGTNNDAALAIVDQELTLTLFDGCVAQSFAAADFVTVGSEKRVTVTDSRINIGSVTSVVILDTSNRRVMADYEVKAGSLDLIVNAIPDNAFDGSITILTAAPKPSAMTVELTAPVFPFTFQAQPVMEIDGNNGGLTNVNTWFSSNPNGDRTNMDEIISSPTAAHTYTLAAGQSITLYAVGEYRRSGSSSIVDNRNLAAELLGTFDGTNMNWTLVGNVIEQSPGVGGDFSAFADISFNDVVAGQSSTSPINTLFDNTRLQGMIIVTVS